ncbi:MAG: hypothetical protein LBL58_02305 [Tannerellaceae bacterium]|jgi:hypothetical protein|nr:hypothetical protein [Tannerellaceae bacterium]
MHLKQLFFLAIILFCGSSCKDDTKPGHISRIGLETFSIKLSERKDSATVKTIEPSWDIYSILIENEKEINNNYIKHFPNGSIISVLCDTMTYEWLTLIKISPVELKIIAEENPLGTVRSATVELLGGVGYFGENLQVSQTGKQ